MKCGTLAAKELTDFFRESAKLEEENAKTHAKLAKQVRDTISSKKLNFIQDIYFKKYESILILIESQNAFPHFS